MNLKKSLTKLAHIEKLHNRRIKSKIENQANSGTQRRR
jgi:hypothetical protein